MSERIELQLHEPVQAHKAIMHAWGHAKNWLMAGHRLVLTIKPQKRSSEQNAKFHAICSDLSRSGLLWAGKPRSASEWKVLLVSGHSMATKQGAEIVPGLEGEFVNIRESTARMSRARGSSLIEYALAFCAANNVALRDYRQWMQET